MGFELDCVISEPRYCGAFVCAICQNLADLDALVTTECSHCFCRNCLQQWLERQPSAVEGPPVSLNCPTCNCSLKYSNRKETAKSKAMDDGAIVHNNDSTAYMMMGGHSCLIRPLKTHQPLAYRLLQSLLVRCPLQGVSCGWKGDYGDIQAHMISSTAHTNPTADFNSSVSVSVSVSEAVPESVSESATAVASEAAFEAASTSTFDQDSAQESPCKDMEVQAEEDALSQEIQAIEQQQSLALSLKEEANNQFVSRHYKEAQSLYTRAIAVLLEACQEELDGRKVCPERPTSSSTKGPVHLKQQYISEARHLLAMLYCNRAASHLNLHAYAQCVDDCTESSKWDPSYSKSYIRKSRALVQLGNFSGAIQTLGDGIERIGQLVENGDEDLAVDVANSNNLDSLMKELNLIKHISGTFYSAHKQIEKGEYAAAKVAFGSLMKETMASRVLLGVAKADLCLGSTDAALTMTMRVLRNDPQNPEGCQIRGMTIFHMGDYDHGLKLIRQAGRLDPESKAVQCVLKMAKQLKECIEGAKQKSFHRQFREALELLTKALHLCIPNPPRSPIFASLYTQRAEVFLRLKRYADCLKDCALVLYSQEMYIPAWLIKFQAYHGLGQHEDAFDEASDLMQKNEGNVDMGIQKAYEKADFELRKQRRPDFYGILEVSSLASEVEIKKAYKQRCLQYHPDRHSQKAKKEQMEAERKFKILGEALETLTDNFKRKLHDEGFDQAAIRQRVEAAQQAAHRGYGGHGHGHSRYQ